MARLQPVQSVAQVGTQRDQFAQQPRRAYLTAAGAVAHLNLGSLSALYYHIRQNRLPYGRVGNRYRFDPTRLDAWVASGGRDVLVRKVG